MNILPKPRVMEKLNGEFLFKSHMSIELDTSCGERELYSAKILKCGFEELEVDCSIIKSLPNRAVGDIRIKIEKEMQQTQNLENEEEAYIIEIKEEYISLIATNSKGIFYGVQTLKQIIQSGARRISCAKIIDYPEFKVRGFYHDITRGKVPTLETLKGIVDDLAKYKINQFQLYVEHVFPFRGHEEVWAHKDPITPEEILELDKYCMDNHIELVPSIATFGHLYHLLSSEHFGHLCELEGSKGKGFSWVDRMRHHTIDISNSDSIKVIEGMIEDYLPLFTSNKFNICCDETFDLGKGRSKGYVEEIGKGRAYLDFLNKLIHIVKRNGKTPMFWGDIILNYPELLNEISEDVICLNWNYSPEATNSSTKTLSESKRKFYTCPAVWGWDRFMNDIKGSFSNIKKMVSYGKEFGAEGVLCTDWGDYGHVNSYASSKPGMILSAALSWNSDLNIETLESQISEVEFGDRDIVSLMKELGEQQYVSFMEIVWWMENKKKKTTLLMERPELIEKYMLNKSEEELKQSYSAAVKIEEVFKDKMYEHSKCREDIKSFILSARVVGLLNSLYLYIKEWDFNEKVDGFIHDNEELATLFEKWLNEYKEIWRKDNKESELYRIEEFFIEVCIYLRRGDGKVC
ncbi:beta-N-acetylhexosaminidase [Oceanirhabdus sp. W0125-5]|uniref:beta-N-acetylhexosaminidase n=1 Tax=Oceanirhabdus sp. W0125-5 TaxID=2999116 RepID=UPI0022F3236D|nr:glycoside hydrolase family 20 zincin-like fold domain-containing protein [Oceanirhabdus sp. W0125-5]WBW97871.1 glycoside hydrolase family 20 zincin-like fold domain-containing protein [Oceanirhabdus sp. W0125-5]